MKYNILFFFEWYILPVGWLDATHPHCENQNPPLICKLDDVTQHPADPQPYFWYYQRQLF